MYGLKFIFLNAFIALNVLLGNCKSDAKVYRALIPNSKVKWFSDLINQKPEIDVWLSIRLNRPHPNSSDQVFGKYKYFSEFRLRKMTSEELIVFTDLLESNSIRLEVIINDLDRLSNSREKRLTSQTNRFRPRSHKKIYKSFYNIKKWMVRLRRKYPQLVRVYTIGKTFENRPILVLQLTHMPQNNIKKPLFLFESGIHAREWLSIATNTIFIDTLIKKFMLGDKTVVKILKKYELHFVPVMNPDGYEFSRSSRFNRFWRKNMRYTKSDASEFACFGVDLNRNFDFKWMVSGASANPCSEIHAGPYPASEPEVKSVMNYIMSKSPQWLSYISLHSYGGIWLAPFSYSRTHIQENFEETCHKALIAINTIKNKHGFEYSFGSASHELYEASGCGEDWGKEVAKINHTFVIELKPDSIEHPQTGFVFPEEDVEQAALEVYDGFVEYIRSFFINKVDPAIVQECQNKLLIMQNRLSNENSFDYEPDYEYY